MYWSAVQDGVLTRRLKKARMDARLSQRELARRIGVSPSLLSQIEGGKTRPSVPTLYKMLAELGLSIDDPTHELGSRSTTAYPPTTVGRGWDMEAALLAELRGVVRAGVKTNLSTRLADEIEKFLLGLNLLKDVDLPSSRHIAEALGVHRNTVRSAFDALVERSIVCRNDSGRFTVQIVQQSLRRAATAWAQKAGNEDSFADLARSVYSSEMRRGGEVVFVGDFESITELGPDSLKVALGMSVLTEPVENVPSLSAPVVITSTRNIAEVRRLARRGTEVLSIGAMLDVDIRIALAELQTDAHIAVVVDSPGVREAIEWRIGAWRPDVQVIFTGGSDALPDQVALALLPAEADAPAFSVPHRTYRRGIASGELELVRARVLAALPPNMSNPLVPIGGWPSFGVAPDGNELRL